VLIAGSSRHLHIVSKLVFFKSLCNGGAAVFLLFGATVVELMRRRKLLKKDEDLSLGSVSDERMLLDAVADIRLRLFRFCGTDGVVFECEVLK
jgi:hypothetical protein